MAGRGVRDANGPWVTLALFIGAPVPCLLAVVLISVFGRDNSESDGPLATPIPAQERLRVPFNRAETTLTEGEYAGTVRLIVEGSGQASGGGAFDAFYRDGEAAPPGPAATLELDGAPALDALGLAENPPPYAPDHTYAVLYDVTPTPRRLAFRAVASASDDDDGAFSITVIQLH